MEPPADLTHTPPRPTTPQVPGGVPPRPLRLERYRCTFTNPATPGVPVPVVLESRATSITELWNDARLVLGLTDPALARVAEHTPGNFACLTTGTSVNEVELVFWDLNYGVAYDPDTGARLSF